MKTFFSVFAIISLIIIGCNNPKNSNVKSELNTELSSEPLDQSNSNNALAINKQVADSIDGGVMLLGPINHNGLNQEPYSVWLEENAAAYTPDMSTLDEIKPLLKTCYVKVFMGTWCEDSQREVPALLKLLKLTDFDQNQLEIIAMTHDKDTPNNLEAGYDIEFIPTIMVFKDGAELNRIVEYTQETLEQDLLNILKQEPYTPAYAD